MVMFAAVHIMLETPPKVQSKERMKPIIDIMEDVANKKSTYQYWTSGKSPVPPSQIVQQLY